MYDLIGDIHGHADELVELLSRLDYQNTRGVYAHPDRRVIFVGDFIDRGPKIRQVLEIVRPMVELGTALTVMGNHELNALAYHTEDAESPGEYLRHRTPKNVEQHCETLNQLQPQELRNYLDWFRTLPLWLDLDSLRVVHACWDERSMNRIAKWPTTHKCITTEFLHSACRRGNELFGPVEVVLKGKEAALPNGKSFKDGAGVPRTEIRTRWYLSPNTHTYRTYALQSMEIDCDLELEQSVVQEAVPYPVTAKPVFFGHYWLSMDKKPDILAQNVACLDYSVAKKGHLCAYRWHGEQKLNNDHFVWVEARS